MFSIIIPTWNNLDYVRLCVDKIRQNSAFEHQIILHINDGHDGTLDWAKSSGLDYTYTAQNAGICFGVNLAAGLANQDYIVYLNDDMYVLPGWDTALLDEIKCLGTDCFMLSGTMIEPRDSGNKCVIVGDYGDSILNFKEESLLKEYRSWSKNDWNGSKWPPTVVHRKYWAVTGGYSLEFSPGMSSDDDFAMKMWLVGCRIFKGVAASRVYHFQCKSTGRIVGNNGRKQFLAKWGILQSTFNKLYLRTGTPYQGILSEPRGNQMKWELFRAKIKKLLQ